MTWYRGDERIGEDIDLANWMLSAVIEQSIDEAPDWQDRFESYVDDTFTPMEVMRLCEHDGHGYNEFFIDWVNDLIDYDTDFREEYGFEWREEE